MDSNMVAQPAGSTTMAPLGPSAPGALIAATPLEIPEILLGAPSMINHIGITRGEAMDDLPAAPPTTGPTMAFMSGAWAPALGWRSPFGESLMVVLQAFEVLQQLRNSHQRTML